MNPLRLNLAYALLSFALLLSLVSISHPESGPATQAIRVTQRSASAVANFVGYRCERELVPRIDPIGALKQIVRSLR